VFEEGPAPNPIAILFEELPEKFNPALSPIAMLLDPVVQNKAVLSYCCVAGS
jgi:hypothetical protein